MASIKEYLAQILSARYGKDVRQAIHDSIRDINDIATTAQDSATSSAGTAAAKASEALAASQSATEKAQEALESAEQAKMYAENASAVTGIEIATEERAGLMKGGENTVDEDGTLVLTRKASGETIIATDSYDAGFEGLKTFGKSVQETGTITDDEGNEITIPCPAYPQPIVSAGQELDADGNVVDVGITKRLAGKNLLKNTASTATHNGVTFTVNEDGSVTVNGTNSSADTATYISLNEFTLQPNEKYIISGCPKTGSDTTYSIMVLDTVSWKAWSEYGGGKTFNTDSLTEFVARIRVAAGATVSNLTFKPMIRYADIEDDTWEPYVDEQTLTLNRVLRGIPVTDASLANYTDENGQMWCADEIDVERKVLVQRVGEHIFDGDETWNMESTMGTNWRFILQTTFIDRTGLSNTTIAPILCNVLQAVSPNSTYGPTSKNEIALNSNGQLYVTCDYEDLDSLKAALSETPWIINCILATPIETPLTDEEIAAYKALHSNYPTTVITNDAGAWMEVEYATSRVGAIAMEANKRSQRNEAEGLQKTGDSKDNTVTFTSGDALDSEENPLAWTDVEVMASGEKHSGLLGKISAMFKNIRYLYKMLGTTDISTIGDGTATGAIKTLNNNLIWENLGQKSINYEWLWFAGNTYKELCVAVALEGTYHIIFIPTLFLTSDARNFTDGVVTVVATVNSIHSTNGEGFTLLAR